MTFDDRQQELPLPESTGSILERVPYERGKCMQCRERVARRHRARHDNSWACIVNQLKRAAVLAGWVYAGDDRAIIAAAGVPIRLVRSVYSERNILARQYVPWWAKEWVGRMRRMGRGPYHRILTGHPTATRTGRRQLKDELREVMAAYGVPPDPSEHPEYRVALERYEMKRAMVLLARED